MIYERWKIVKYQEVRTTEQVRQNDKLNFLPQNSQTQTTLPHVQHLHLYDVFFTANWHFRTWRVPEVQIQIGNKFAFWEILFRKRLNCRKMENEKVKME